jgi:hypothetical protein
MPEPHGIGLCEALEMPWAELAAQARRPLPFWQGERIGVGERCLLAHFER